MSSWISAASAEQRCFGVVSPPDLGWLAKQPDEPVIDPALPIIDAHHHLWDFPGNRYLLPEFSADLDTGHNVVGCVFVECTTHYRTSGPEALRPVGQTEFAAQMAARLAAGSPPRSAGIVGFADLSLGADEVDAVLAAQQAAGQGYLKGIRYSGGWDADARVGNSHNQPGAGVYRSGRLDQGLAALARRQLVFEVWAYHPQLDDVLHLARRFPSLPIVVNHVGGPLGYGPYAGQRDTVYAQWRQSIRALAGCANVCMKLGGMTIRLAAFDYRSMAAPPDSQALATLWRPYIDACVEAFGAQRCMFESNFPVEKIGTGYRTLWNAFKRLAAAGSAAEREALFAGTARRIYRLGPAAAAAPRAAV